MFKTLLLERHLSYPQAAVYALFAYFMFTVSDTMGKWLMSEGFNRSHVLVASCTPAIVVLLALMIKRHGIKRCLYTQYRPFHLMRCLAMVSVTFCTFVALKALPLAEYYGVIFSSPLVMTLAACFLFREKTDPGELIAIVIGFLGVLTVVQPDFDNFNFGYLWAFLGVVSLVSAGLIVRKIGRDEDPYLFVLYGNIAIAFVNLGPAIIYDLPQITLSHIAVFTVYSATIPTAILVLSALYARAPSITAVAPYQYSQIIWGSVLGYILFGDIPQHNTIIGSVIVIGCGLYILFHHRRKTRRQLMEAAMSKTSKA